MQCARTRISLLFPFALILIVEGNDRTRVLTPFVKGASPSRCLLQSSHNVASLRVVQPSIILPPRVNASNTSSVNRSEELDDEDFTIGQAYTWWTKYVIQMTHNWPTLLLWFSIGFSICVPFLHWYFEHRDAERAMFMKTNSNGVTIESTGNGNDSTQDTSAQSVAGSSPARDRHPEPSPSGEPANNQVPLAPKTVGEARFVYIAINRTGGINKIKKLIEVDRPRLRRPFKVFTRIVSISFNVYMLIQQDTKLLQGAEKYYDGTDTGLPDSLKRYLEFTGNMSLISVRHAVCVAVAELLGLAAMTIWFLYRLTVFILCRDVVKAKYDAFVSLYETCDALTLLSSFSALRLINVAHPAMLIRKCQFFMARPFMADQNWPKHVNDFWWYCQLLYFCVTRIFAVFLGCLAFGVKMAFCSVQVHMALSPDGNWLSEAVWRWLVIIMLLVQTLGAIGVEHVMWWRVLLIVVEGGDRRVTLEKIRKANVYLSKVFEKIYEGYYLTGKYLQFCVLMLTFDHIDLQHLLIDEASDAQTDADVGDDVVGISPDGFTDLFSGL